MIVTCAKGERIMAALVPRMGGRTGRNRLSAPSRADVVCLDLDLYLWPAVAAGGGFLLSPSSGRRCGLRSRLPVSDLGARFEAEALADTARRIAANPQVLTEQDPVALARLDGRGVPCPAGQGHKYDRVPKAAGQSDIAACHGGVFQGQTADPAPDGKPACELTDAPPLGAIIQVAMAHGLNWWQEDRSQGWIFGVRIWMPSLRWTTPVCR